jgi:hypothetical protein
MVLQLAAAPAPEPLTRAEVAKLAKPATAMVIVKSSRFGSSFCIHASGLFVTNEHVVADLPADGKVELVLDSGLVSEKVIKARVVRSDRALDLALLQAEGDHKFVPLKLGFDDTLPELTELIAFGFPFGDALGKPGERPAVTINVVNVSALRHDAKRELSRIQLDSNLNPGNSGGPVVDRHGKVMGVVVSGIRGTGINLAIPVRHLHQFLDRPVITFKAPLLNRTNQHESVEFQATATALSGDPLDLELILASRDGQERRFPMKGKAGQYSVKAVPFPAPKSETPLRVEIKYQEGSVSAAAKEHEFKVGMDSVKLGNVVSLTPGAKGQVVLNDGKKLEGPVTGLDTLTVSLGGQPLELRLAEATEVRVIPPRAQNQLTCTVVARRESKELGRHTETVYLEGAVMETLEGVREGKFVKPRAAGSPTSYLKAVSSTGDFIGQGKTYLYEEKDLQVKATGNRVSVKVDGWNIEFAAPRGGTLAVGDYPNAKRYPFNAESPGLSFSGHGRSASKVGGHFVVWELELKDGQVVRLGIDFIHRAEETGPPLFGKLRYNSTLD